MSVVPATDHELSAEQLLGPGRADVVPDDSQPVPTEIPPATGGLAAAFGIDERAPADLTDAEWNDMLRARGVRLPPGAPSEPADDAEGGAEAKTSGRGPLDAAFGLWRDMPDEPFAVYEQPEVIYVADHGCWFPKTYEHVDAVPYYPRADHDVLHQRCVEAEALAFNATNALAVAYQHGDDLTAALRAIVEADNRRDYTARRNAIEAARALLCSPP